MKTKYDIEQEWQPNQWREFFSSRKSLSAQAKERGYNPSTAVRFFSQDPEFLSFKESFKPVSDAAMSRYKDAVNWCKEMALVPLFTESDWKGLVSWDPETKNTLSVKYQVKCNVCGRVFTTCFKSSVPHCSKCRHTDVVRSTREIKHKPAVQKDPLLFYKELLKSSNLQFTGKSLQEAVDSNFFHVKNLNSGVEYTTSIVDNKFIDYNPPKPAVPDYQKIAASYNYTVLSKVGNDYHVKCNRCGTEFLTILSGNRMRLCPTCEPVDFRSNRERYICTLLDAYHVHYIANYKFSYQDGTQHELDIFVPSKNLAFEFNGFYFHHSGKLPHAKPKDYHIRKTNECQKQGIRLIHIWENVSDELVESIVLSKLGYSKRVFARTLKVETLDNQSCKNFFDKYHIDGNVRFTIAFALCDESGPVCALSLNQRRIQSSGITQWEIARFATRYGINVVGGYSRLLKHAKDYLIQQGCHELISYCNRDLSPFEEETVYHKLGFTFEQESGPIYKYWASRDFFYLGRNFKRGTILSRQVFQKQKLVKHYSQFENGVPVNCTELSMTNDLGCYPCYNSGNFKYSLKF